LSFAYYLKKDYKTCISIGKSLYKRKDVIDRVYQLVGNSQDLLGEPDKAIETYKTGMKAFPNSGRLYLEAGVVERKRDEPGKAISYWEAGIKADPDHASNYYWLAKTFADSEEPIWSFFYGEIFMNLELNSERTIEISKLLYQNYEKSLRAEADSTIDYQMTKKGFQIVVKNKREMKKIKKGKTPVLPFEGTYSILYSAMGKVLTQRGINLNSIYEVRLNIVNNWHGKNDHGYTNGLIDRQKTIIDAGFFEAYSYWILSQGDTDAFEAWLRDNEESFRSFAIWIQNNPLRFEPEDKYARLDY
jgi:tetratricopeptide (TPR) repeat protein